MALRPLAVLMPLVLALLAGCISTGTDGGLAPPTPYRGESATYGLWIDDVRLGTVEHDVSWRGDVVTAHAIVARDAAKTPFGPRSASMEQVKATYDAATGLQHRVQDGRWTTFSWGTQAHMPTAAQALVGALAAPLEASVIPLGPQWAVGTIPSGQWTPWGEIELRVTVPEGGGWVVDARGACQQACAFAGVSDPTWHTTLAGDGHGILPATVTMGLEGDPMQLHLLREAHRVEGVAVALHAAAPAAPVAHGATALCDRLLCEAPDWPERLSFQHARTALDADPRWHAWREAHPGVYPVQSVVSRDGTVRVLGTDTIHYTTWTLQFAAPDGATLSAELQAPHHPDGGLGPAVVVRVSTGQEEAGRAWPESARFLALEETMAALAQATGVPLEEVGSIWWTNDDPAGRPDPRAWSHLAIAWGGVGDGWATASPADGRVTSLRTV